MLCYILQCFLHGVITKTPYLTWTWIPVLHVSRVLIDHENHEKVIILNFIIELYITVLD